MEQETSTGENPCDISFPVSSKLVSTLGNPVHRSLHASRHLEIMHVILSAAKDLASRT